MRWYFARSFADCIESRWRTAKTAAADGKLVLGGLAVMIAVLLTASAQRRTLACPLVWQLWRITAVVSIKAKSNPLTLAKEISWGTLLLVAGLFVMVDAVESIGALRLTQAWLARCDQGLAQAAGALVTVSRLG